MTGNGTKWAEADSVIVDTESDEKRGPLTINIRGNASFGKIILATTRPQGGFRARVAICIKSMLAWLIGTITALNNRIKIPTEWMCSEDMGTTWAAGLCPIPPAVESCKDDG